MINPLSILLHNNFVGNSVCMRLSVSDNCCTGCIGDDDDGDEDGDGDVGGDDRGDVDEAAIGDMFGGGVGKLCASFVSVCGNHYNYHMRM